MTLFPLSCRGASYFKTFGLALLCLASSGICQAAQNYPLRTVRFVVPVPAGGSVDAMARIVADKLQSKWGQPVIIENKPGAGNLIGMEFVIQAEPNGYTLLFGPGSPVLINKLLRPNRRLDPETLKPVSMVAINPVLHVVHPKVPAKTLAEFVAYAKANPGKLNYASAGEGGVPNLTAKMFEKKAGVLFTKVPYRGVAPAMTDLLTGQIDMIFVDISTAIEYVRAGKLRVLGVAAKNRHQALPEVPALPEYYPDLIAETWFAVYAPPKTSTPIIEKISTAIAEAIKEPDVQKRLKGMGDIEAVGSTPAAMADFMQKEKERWGAVIKDAGIKID